MYGNINAYINKNGTAIPDKPQHIMYGNPYIGRLVPFQRGDKPQHIMYGNLKACNGMRNAFTG